MAITPLASILPTRGVHAALDELGRLDPAGLNASGQAELLVDIKRITSRLDAYRLRVLAAAEAAKTASKSGDADTGAWAAKHTNDDARETSRQTKLAAGLKEASPTQQALSEGDISEGHAEVIVGAGKKLPEDLTPGERKRVEEDLVEKAKTMPPSKLRQRARRQLEALNKDRETVDKDEEAQVADEEERARAKTRFTMHDNGDGTASGNFTLPILHAHILRKILQSMTAPRRTNGNGRSGDGNSGNEDGSGSAMDPARNNAGAGFGGESACEDLAALPDPHRVARGHRTDWANAQGLALAGLIEHLPTDHLHPKTAATIVVTLDEEVLRGYLATAGLDTGEAISAAQARQLACNSGLVPAVLGGKPVPLDLGREARLFTEGQRTALAIRHTSCAGDGCQRPFAWCELHHALPWSNGGRTDLDNAVPLCHYHHRLAHDHRYIHTRTAAGGHAFTMRQ